MILNYVYDDDGGIIYEITVNVFHYEVVPANPLSWDSREDFYGYTELEWEVDSFIVVDRDGRILHSESELPMHVMEYIESCIYGDAAEYAREEACDRGDYLYNLSKEY